MENFWWSQAFSTWAHLKLVSPKWRENSVGRILWLNNKIAHCTNFVPLLLLFFCLLFWAFVPFKTLFFIIIIFTF